MTVQGQPRMSIIRRFLPVLVVAGLTAPVPMAAAQDEFELGAVPKPKAPAPLFASSIELGMGYQSLDSFAFGRYGGNADKGPFAIVDATVSGWAPWDSDKTAFWDASARVYGTDTRSVQARYGVHGSWRISGFYDAFTRFYTETGRSPFTGIGTAQLSLPANWVGTASSLLFPALTQNLKRFELKNQWQTVGGDYVLNPRSGYEVRLHFDHRHRDGLKPQSLAFGHEANFPVGVFFPQPVDYNSNRLNASIGYANRALQWQAMYALSTFSNDIAAVMVPNPYSRSIGLSWPAGAFAGFPFAVGQYSLPPDNTAHQFSLTGGYAVSAKTRLTAKFSYALQRQNDPFLPYTTNVNLLVPTPLPRSSFGGKVHKTFASVALTSRAWARVDLAASYTYDDRDNRSPRDLYTYVPNDSQDQPQPLILGNTRYSRYNLPYSFTFHQAKVELGYRLAPRTRVSVAYTGDFRARDYQEVSNSSEHTVRAKALSSFAFGSAWVAYSYAARRGSSYADEAPWNASHTDGYLNASPSSRSIEYPLLRRYNLADRKRHEAKTGLTFSLSDALTADLSGGYARDRYFRSLFGLRRTDSLLLDADLSYVLKDRLTASAFYSFERIRSDQKGYYIFTASLTNPAQEWGAQNNDAIHSGGVRLDWQAIPEKVKLGAIYYVSRARTRIGVQATPFTLTSTVRPLPDVRELTHNASLRADYNWRPNTAFRLGYAVERRTSADWQYDRIAVAPVAQILGAGIMPPRYTAHVVSLSARYQY